MAPAPAPAGAPAGGLRDAPLRVVLVTMDSHLACAAQRARRRLAADFPSLVLSVHAAAEWHESPAALQRCRAEIAEAHLVIVTMLFMEDHYLPVLDALAARRDRCDAMVCAMCAAEVMRLTRMGRFAMDTPGGGPLAWLRRWRGGGTGAHAGAHGDAASVAGGNRGRGAGATPASGAGPAGAQGAAARQMKMLRRLPRLLRFVPGTAQDLRAYFLVLQYWLAGSEDNIAALVHLLVGRYAGGARLPLRARARPAAPVCYPEVGLYHPRATGRIVEDLHRLPRPATASACGTVGLLLMRSYLLADNTAHYDGVIAALEARGLQVVPAFATGLDARPAVERYFLSQGRATVDAVVSLTGFSLVGGPAYNDARAAETLLARLDVPYLAVTPLEFQTLEQWHGSERGLLPIEATMMVALPELDGATGAMVFGGRSERAGGESAHDMQVHPERAAALAARVARWVALRRSARAGRRVGIVLFNFPPNSGAAGTAAFLSVFESLHAVLVALRRQGYAVDVPDTPEALRERVTGGNASRHGAAANVHARIPADTILRDERWLPEIEAQWGPAPGRHQSDGRAVQVLGERFGNVFVGLQPAFGCEGDPMRLLFDRGFAPTHAFAAFYRWLREDFGADVLLHFGTHGALEFMPGKQAGLSEACWPDRLLGDLPNVYLYASNNPSEGTLAKRRTAAVLVSHLTPPITEAGLYRGLAELKTSIERWRGISAGFVAPATDRLELARDIQVAAAALELAAAEPAWTLAEADAAIGELVSRLVEAETTLIPHGLHVLGRPPSRAARIDLLQAIAASRGGLPPTRALIEALVDGAAQPPGALPDTAALLAALADTDRHLVADHEIAGLLHALDGGYLRPAPGGDVLRSPDVLPTGRNLHGFDPSRMPSAWAVRDGTRQAARLLERHVADGHALPESVAMVLWGTDNLKNEGAPIAQALALMGARPRFDGYGRLAGAELLPLAALGRPRIDVMITLSGIFRDLLPLQIRLLAEAAYLAASADEPDDANYVRRHALAFQREHGVDLETAALRVFGNAEGAYGANVNHLIDASCWAEEDELAEAYTRRKGYAYGREGRPAKHPALLDSVLAGVSLAYQNLESVEVGVTTLDTYFDTLGGVSRAVHRARRARGAAPEAATPVYIGDQTRGAEGEGLVRTLSEQVTLETRTRMLNPKWYEGLLDHGYEGVRQIEAAVTNTMGWSATTGQVQPWVYQRLSETFLLDTDMRERLARLNPAASAKVARRLLEACERRYWQPEPEVLAALQRAEEDLEDRLEGIQEGVPA